MSSVVVACSCCGYQYAMPEGVDLLVCPACGTQNARPKVEGPMLADLTRAIEERLACDFVNAEESYQQVLRGHPHNHEALWGKLLCHYGVEYVTDPKTGKRMPTVHTVRTRPVKLSADFRAACRHAPEEIRAQYEQDAAYIDQAQTKIRELAQKCPVYDVFLCHKATKPGSADLTQDYYRANKLYYYLKDKGVNVFFAPESLANMAGANYEAGIYHALHTAKAMLLFCSESTYLTSAWVRSEWSRFLELMDEGEEKRLIPLFYDRFDPYQLPEEIQAWHLQGLTMDEAGADEKLMDNLQAMVTATPKPDPKHVSSPHATPVPPKPVQPEEITISAPEQPQPTAKTTIIDLPRSRYNCHRDTDCTGCEKYLECAKVSQPTIKVDKGRRTAAKWGATMSLQLSNPAQISIYATYSKKVHLVNWIGTAIAAILSIVAIVLYSSGETDAAAVAFFFGFVGLGSFPIFELCCWMTKYITLTAFPGKHYRLYWKRFTGLHYEEITD